MTKLLGFSNEYPKSYPITDASANGLLTTYNLPYNLASAIFYIGIHFSSVF
jgi:hypothetical protein